MLYPKEAIREIDMPPVWIGRGWVAAAMGSKQLMLGLLRLIWKRNLGLHQDMLTNTFVRQESSGLSAPLTASPSLPPTLAAFRSSRTDGRRQCKEHAQQR